MGAVLRLLEDVGYACARFHSEMIREIPAKRVQCDEVWCYCYCKDKNRPEGMEDKLGVGSQWTYIGLDSDTKLVISYFIGDRSSDHAYQFMVDLSGRISGRPQVTTDGFPGYSATVPRAFDGNVDFAQLVKLYAADREADARYSPPICIGADLRPVHGNPAVEAISTSHVERQNLTMRMQMRRFTRLTNGFSKKITNLRYAVALHMVFYNFCRPHRSLQSQTPAMVAGLAGRKLTLEDVAQLPSWVADRDWGNRLAS
jgi:IS1 family transposase